MSIDQYSDRQLQDEMKRRADELQRRANEEKRRLARPKPLDEPDWSTLIATIEDFVDRLDRTGYVKDDADHYIFEAAVEALYGSKIFNWWDNRSDGE